MVQLKLPRKNRVLPPRAPCGGGPARFGFEILYGRSAVWETESRANYNNPFLPILRQQSLGPSDKLVIMGLPMLLGQEKEKKNGSITCKGERKRKTRTV